MWRHLKRYGPKWHNLTSLWSQISIFQVRGPKWNLKTSLRTTGVFNSNHNWQPVIPHRLVVPPTTYHNNCSKQPSSMFEPLSIVKPLP